MKKTVSIPEFNTDKAGSLFLIAVKKGRYQEAINIVESAPIAQRSTIICSRGKSSGKNFLEILLDGLQERLPNPLDLKSYLKSQLHQAFPPERPSSELKTLLGLAKSDWSALQGEKNLFSGNHALATRLYSAMDNDTLTAFHAIFGVQEGTHLNNDSMTNPCRHLSILQSLPDLVQSRTPSIMLIGPGYCENKATELINFQKPFSPLLYELCRTFPESREMAVVDYSQNVLNVLSDTELAP